MTQRKLLIFEACSRSGCLVKVEMTPMGVTFE